MTLTRCSWCSALTERGERINVWKPDWVLCVSCRDALVEYHLVAAVHPDPPAETAETGDAMPDRNVRLVALLDQVAVPDAEIPSTARRGETIRVTRVTADRLLALEACRPWEPGDGEPVPDGIRLPQPRSGPASVAEAPSVNPAPTSNAQELLDAYEREHAKSAAYVPPQRRTPAEAKAERQRLDAEEDGRRRRLQPWTPEGAAAIRAHGRAVEARRKVAARRAEAEEARRAAEQARTDAEVEAEIAAEEARLARMDER